LTVNVVLGAVALALAEPELELELELELEELEHPAAPSRPTATTVTPSRVAERRLKLFTRRYVCDPSDAGHTGVQREGERLMARR
jgi:hypothetical protein